MTTPLLIVVPTLDSFGLLPRLCTSLCEQSWSGWRVLFIDGPSSAEHREWLSQCCLSDSRFSWIPQDPNSPGIFGAMNQGFTAAAHQSVEWLLFWGSDDWAASSTIFAEVFEAVHSSSSLTAQPDLIVCRGRYVNLASKYVKRSTSFHPECCLDASSYRLALLLGATPPHQATLFGVGARKILGYYTSGFRLSADLDYFLRLSISPNICIRCLDLDLVYMSDCGVSATQTKRRLKEVRWAYKYAFGLIWWLPFLLRYIRRFVSLLSQS
ncbi:glycosyltransferase [Synechococcus sp. PROS-9-1]|uniref:glycosyltransferase n=1 Tax=Synechococcus sp. PROS-9-1 TaxID=1968775 RepID=UPI0016441E5F|nr:glycosyltransferase [Synechococcus sp. PROS-9-1]